uniref:Uncharacterized protein n=1 Tax=Timema tahoe TaxID=61484 RepID=A0A7R9IL94_9NEOP|nr:unnamed protein product [Timema tahoe]
MSAACESLHKSQWSIVGVRPVARSGPVPIFEHRRLRLPRINVEDKIIPQTLKQNRYDNFPVYNFCKMEGCLKNPLNSGYCWLHACNSKCKTDGCTKFPLIGGYCGQHGEGSRDFRIIKTKSFRGRSLKGGHCQKHGGTGPRLECQGEGCSKFSLNDGTWMKHRDSYMRLPCKTKGCRKWPLSNGHCMEHGGIFPRLKCKTKDCSNWPLVGNGLCREHVVIHPRLKCKTKDCYKWPLSIGHCAEHGASPKRVTSTDECGRGVEIEKDSSFPIHPYRCRQQTRSCTCFTVRLRSK